MVDPQADDRLAAIAELILHLADCLPSQPPTSDKSGASPDRRPDDISGSHHRDEGREQRECGKWALNH